MSVPKSERHESSVAYLYNATVFGSKSMKLLSQMSKKWKTYNLDYYSSLIHGIIETLATANAIYPKDEQEMIRRQNPAIEKDWDERYGDRVVKLVFIGQNMDKENIIETLDKCIEK